jgi:hypothetical protein
VRHSVGGAILGLLALPHAASAQPVTVLDPVVVTAPPPLQPDAASAFHIPGPQLRDFPLVRPGEVLEATPGLVVTQHSGEGKANQYFLRGFNLDHGTDLAIFVDGMPMNMLTHGHGQGYADINFLIPELLAGMEVRKGPYFADLGDFATAGALQLGLVDRLDRPFVLGTVGSFGYWRGLAAGSWQLDTGTLLAAGEVVAYRGPWDRPDDFRKLNGVLRWSHATTVDNLTVTAMAYDGRWHSTDQIPARAVEEGIIGRFGTLNPTDGGSTARYSLSASWTREGAAGVTQVRAYGIRSNLTLFNDFTYFLDDPDNGDQFRQRDSRWIAGIDARHAYRYTLAGLPAETRIGLQSRYDDIRLGLTRTTSRAWLSTVREDHVNQGGAGIWTDTTLRFNDWLRGTAGLRVDWAGGSVHSLLPQNSGDSNAAIASPKIGAVLGPFRQTEFFVNAGTGFHSNDLRGTTITVDPVDPLVPLARVPLLVRAKGAEIGVRTTAIPGLESSLAFFVLTLGSEIVFVGDAGTTEASRPSRRVGIEWVNRWRPFPWVVVDADLAATRARFTSGEGDGPYVPGAPNVIASAGIVLGEATGWFASARLRYFGPRPLTEDGQVRSQATTLLSTRGGYRFENGITLQMDVFNLFNAQASQIDYFYTSRLAGEPLAGEPLAGEPLAGEPLAGEPLAGEPLAGEPLAGEPLAGVADRHFHPVEPFAVRFSAVIPL